MDPNNEEIENKTSSVYITPRRVALLHKAAIRVSYETDRPKQFTASEFARYLVDNFLDRAIEQLIRDSKKRL